MIGVLAPRVRRNRGFAVGLAVAFVVPAASLLAASIVASRQSSSLQAERRAFTAYETAVERAVQDGGFVVTQGMKLGLADITEGRFPDATLMKMAGGWTRSMMQVRRKLTMVEPPTILREVARRYDAALAAYVRVGESLLAAARARGDERAALVQKVPPLGERADALWNEASAALERQRVRLDLVKKDRSGGGADVRR